MHRGYTCLWRKIWSNALLAEPGKKFSRLEAWLYITNVLAAPMGDGAAGLKRGEFKASIRQFAGYFNWSIGAAHRFREALLQNSMIVRVEHLVEHFSICNYETYNAPRNTWWNTEDAVEHLNVSDKETYSVPRDTARNTGGVCINNNINNNNTDTHSSAARDACVSPKILLEMYQQHNQELPEVKAVTAERLRKCRSRINQAVRDGCLEQYLADFSEAVKKAQQTPFLRGEGARGWRASFDWFVANQVNVYAVLEGKYDGPAFAKATAGLNNGGGNDIASFDGGRSRGPAGRTSRGDPIYFPRQ